MCHGGPAAQARSRLPAGPRSPASAPVHWSAPAPVPRCMGTRVPRCAMPVPMPGGTHHTRVSPLLRTGPEWRRHGPAAPRSSCGPKRPRTGLARPMARPRPGLARPAGAPCGGTAPHDCGRGNRAGPHAEGALSWVLTRKKQTKLSLEHLSYERLRELSPFSLEKTGRGFR